MGTDQSLGFLRRRRRKRIRATKFTVNLPFGLGNLDFEPDEIQERTAWALFLEVTTRVALQPLADDEGSLREALTSIYSLFELTRQVLREAGPGVANGPNSLGPVAIDILNKGLRPFTSFWHSRLLSHEQEKPAHISAIEYESQWELNQTMRAELKNLRKDMRKYANALAQIADVNVVLPD